MSTLAEFASKRGQLPHYKDVAAAIAALRPATPVYALIPNEFRAAARAFREGFAGETMYAVKANHAAPVLDQVYAAGTRRFDVASIAEVKAIDPRTFSRRGDEFHGTGAVARRGGRSLSQV